MAPLLSRFSLDVQPIKPVEPLPCIGTIEASWAAISSMPIPSYSQQPRQGQFAEQCLGFRPQTSWGRIIGDLTANVADHIAATHKGTHFSHAFWFDVNCTRTAWTVQFMPCDSIKITADILHVDRHMDRRLGSIHQNRNAACLALGDGFYIDHRSQDIRHLGNSHQFCLWSNGGK